MSDDILDSRKKALEAYFYEKDQPLLDALKRELSDEQARHDLKQVSGIQSDDVLNALVACGISPLTLTALGLTPLVFMAWSDKTVAESERKAVLTAAHEKGIPSGSTAHRALELWLDRRPPQELFEAWKLYIGDLMKQLSVDARASFKAEILRQASQVARADGGLMGMGAVSADERHFLHELEAAFEARSQP